MIDSQALDAIRSHYNIPSSISNTDIRVILTLDDLPPFLLQALASAGKIAAPYVLDKVEKYSPRIARFLRKFVG